MIQDKEGNEFVWVPVDSVSKGTANPADDIRLGRYTFGSDGTPTKQQDADDYAQTVIIDSYFQELISRPGYTTAKSLSTFVNKTKANGGYYFGRYEASQGVDGKVDTQVNKTAWGSITQPDASTATRNMYGSDYVESDLTNSYSWDTAIVYIQKYSGNSNYANKNSVNDSSIGQLDTGKAGDEVCNIHDMASNCYEWSTEYSSKAQQGYSSPLILRGGNWDDGSYIASDRIPTRYTSNYAIYSFRPILYLK